MNSNKVSTGIIIDLLTRGSEIQQKTDFSEEINLVMGKIIKISDYLLKTKYKGFNKIKLELEGKEKEIFFEEENFKVDSGDWVEKIIDIGLYKTNPEEDIIEFIIGELAGEQLFTEEAKIRELERHGGRIPTTEEFKAIVNKIGVEQITKVFPGFRFSGDAFFLNQGFCALYATERTTKDRVFNMLHHTGGSYEYFDNRKYDFSIRRVMD